MEAAAVALKVAVDAPAVTVTEAGTTRKLLLLASVTADPPVGEACANVTVQVLAAPWLRLVGLQATPDTSAGASKPIGADCELLPRVAVTVAL
jgi:hypothetical protein